MRYNSFFTTEHSELKKFLKNLDRGDLIDVKMTSSANNDYMSIGFLVIYRELSE